MSDPRSRHRTPFSNLATHTEDCGHPPFLFPSSWEGRRLKGGTDTCQVCFSLQLMLLQKSSRKAAACAVAGSLHSCFRKALWSCYALPELSGFAVDKYLPARQPTLLNPLYFFFSCLYSKIQFSCQPSPLFKLELWVNGPLHLSSQSLASPTAFLGLRESAWGQIGGIPRLLKAVPPSLRLPHPNNPSACLSHPD